MNPVTIRQPSLEEEADILSRCAERSVIPISSSKCDACGKVLEESEFGIRGYASGLELGLCRRCAAHVNTPEAIDSAEKGGHKVHARPIIINTQGQSKANHAMSGSEEVYE